MGVMWMEGWERILLFVLALLAGGGLLYIRLTDPAEFRRIRAAMRQAGNRRRRRSLAYRSLEGETRTAGEDEPFPRGYVAAPDISPGLRRASDAARGVLFVLRIVAALFAILVLFGAVWLFTHLPGFS